MSQSIDDRSSSTLAMSQQCTIGGSKLCNCAVEWKTDTQRWQKGGRGRARTRTRKVESTHSTHSPNRSHKRTNTLGALKKKLNSYIAVACTVPTTTTDCCIVLWLRSCNSLSRFLSPSHSLLPSFSIFFSSICVCVLFRCTHTHTRIVYSASTLAQKRTKTYPVLAIIFHLKYPLTMTSVSIYPICVLCVLPCLLPCYMWLFFFAWIFLHLHRSNKSAFEQINETRNLNSVPALFYSAVS